MKVISYSLFFLTLLVLLITITSRAATRTWQGTTSAFNVALNWSGGAVPTSGDGIVIPANSITLQLNQDYVVTTITVNDTIDLNGYELKATGAATFNAGVINNGTMRIFSSSTTTFAGTTFGAVVYSSANNSTITNTIFNNTVTIVKKSNATAVSKGGNTFNADALFIDSVASDLVLADSLPDIFNGTVTAKTTVNGGDIFLAHRGTGSQFNSKVYLYSGTTGRVYLNYYGTATFKDTVFVNNSSSGGIYFGYSTGSCTIDTNSIIVIGSSGFSSTGTLYLRNMNVVNTSALSLTLSGSARLNFESGSIFRGPVSATATRVYLNGSRFNSTFTGIQTPEGNVTCTGGCYFAGVTSIQSTNAWTYSLGTSSVDSFAAKATITNNIGTMRVGNAVFSDSAILVNRSAFSTTATRYSGGYNGTCVFKGYVLLDNDSSAMELSNTGGNVIFDTHAVLNVSGGFQRNLILQNCTYNNTDSLSIVFNNSTTILTLDGTTTFNCPLNIQSPATRFNDGTYNGPVYVKQLTGMSSGSVGNGGCTFNSTLSVIDSSAYDFRLGGSQSDTMNGNVKLIAYSGGTVTPFRGIFKANLTVGGTQAITFGTTAGKLEFTGSAEQTINNLNSSVPTFQHVVINKSGGHLKLNCPISLLTTDTLSLTKGIVICDTVNYITLNNACVTEGGSDTSYIHGFLKKVGNQAFTFPLGDTTLHTGSYHPLTISAPSTTSSAFTGQYFASQQTAGSSIASSLEQLSTCEYWKFNRTAGSSTPTLTLGWNSNSCNIFNASKTRVSFWSGSQWTDKGNGGTTGNITVGTVTTTSAVTSFGSFTIADSICSTLNASISATDVRCKGANDGYASVLANAGTKPYSYSWLPDTTLTKSIAELSPGDYYVTVTDANGCTASDTTTINDGGKIILSVVTTNSSCHESTGTAKVLASYEVAELGGDTSDSFTYFWTIGGETTDSIGDLSADLYEVIVSDNNGCSEKIVAPVGDSDGPSVSVDSTHNVSCPNLINGAIFVSAPGGGEWTPYPECGEIPGDLIGPGTHNYLYTDTNGCKTAIDATISEPDPVVANISTTQSLCGQSTGTATIDASGGSGSLSYSWNIGETTDVADTLPSGTYSVVITDSHGCTQTHSTIITDSNGPSVSFTSTSPSCYNTNTGSALINASGGAAPYSYSWLYQDQADSLLDSAAAGEYIAMVTDLNGCITMDTLLVKDPKQLQVTEEITDASIDSIADGAIALAISGGTAPYQYYWEETGNTTASINNILSGIYYVTITDANGCSLTADINVNATIGSNDIPIVNSACSCGLPWIDCSPDPVLNIKDDFGAAGDGATNDDCAFQLAAAVIQSMCGTPVVLEIPPGTYMVGYQVFTYDANQPRTYQWSGRNILSLNQCSNVTIRGIPDTNGDIPIIKFKPCTKMGAFDPSTGQRYLHCKQKCNCGSPTTCPPSGPIGNATENYLVASPGNMFDFKNCSDIKIENLELDGNINSFSIGGYFASDQRAMNGVNHFGMNLLECKKVSISNVFAHHFGTDGIQFGFRQSGLVVIDIQILNSKFNWNCRNGMSWIGGAGIKVLNSTFDYNGFGPWGGSAPASGFDIELKDQNYGDIKNGYFSNCQFRFNNAVGMICDKPTVAVSDCFFDHCTFVAGGSGGAHCAWPNAKRFSFSCSNFVGELVGLYDAKAATQVDLANIDFLKFANCTFNERYTNPDNNQTYAYTRSVDAICDNASWPNTTHPYMVNFDKRSRVLFDRCSFNTNDYNQWGHFVGQSGPSVANENSVTIKNCMFTNTELLALPGEYDPHILGVFSYVKLIGYNRTKIANLYTTDNTCIEQNIWENRNSPALRCYTATYCTFVTNEQNSKADLRVPASDACGQQFQPTTEGYFSTTDHSANDCSTIAGIYVDLPIADKYNIYGSCLSADGCKTLVCEWCRDVGGSPLHICGAPRMADPNSVAQNDEEIKVYPTLVSNTLTVEQVPFGKIIDVITVHGNLIMQHVVNTTSSYLDLTVLPTGVYLIRVEGMKVEKIVKF